MARMELPGNFRRWPAIANVQFGTLFALMNEGVLCLAAWTMYRLPNGRGSVTASV